MGCCAANSKHKSNNSQLAYDADFQATGITLSNENIYNLYKFEQILGSGSFGTVKLATPRNNKKIKVAIKTIPKNKLRDKVYLLTRELSILKSLDHPNIVNFFEIYQDQHYVHLVMEYCSGGELFEKIIKKGSFSEQEAVDIMHILFSVVQYIHFKNVIHRDLKPENFLLADKKEGAEIKLIDFGLSNKYNEEGLLTKVGTPLYVAPEVLEGRYGYECDNWALGVIMYVLLCGSHPFNGNSPQEVFQQIKKGKVTFQEKQWRNVSMEAIDLINQLLTVNHKKRIKSSDALKHPWFKIKINPGSPSKSRSQLEHDKIIKLLRNYSTQNRFQKETLKIFLNQMKDSEIKELHEQFKQFDIEGNGIITVNEMKQIMTKLGIEDTEQEITNLIKSMKPWEELKDIHINYSEFIAATLDRTKYLNEEKLWQIFQYYDTDKSGEITITNLKDVMARNGRKLTDQEYKQLLGDQNEKMNFDYFCKLMAGEDQDQILCKLEKKFPVSDQIEI